MKKTAQLLLMKELKINELTEKLSKNETNVLFERFEGSFSASELLMLRSVRPGALGDSKFVRRLLKIQYKSCLSKLLNKSAVGKAFKKKKKESITPSKKKNYRRHVFRAYFKGENR